MKTLQDRPVLLPVRATTVAFLTRQPAPASLPSTRLPFERRVFRVTAAVTLVRKAADSDLHVVLRDRGNQMIAEAPSPSCAPRATAARRKQMGVARAAVRDCAKAVVSGVAFFDFKHGQTGVAPSAPLLPILYLTQALNAILLVPLLILIIGLSTNRQVMGEHAVGSRHGLILWLITAVITLSVAALFWLTVF